jgi:hypothetical protein
MSGPTLVLGSGASERVVPDVVSLLDGYTTDDGTRYLDFVPSVPSSVLVPEDLAVTILINSRVAPPAFKSIQDRGPSVFLGGLPPCALEDSTADERRQVAELVGVIARWPGFACSVATKVLHKKRPDLIPILDNQAIFGAYLCSSWPGERASQQSVYSTSRIVSALDAIWADLVRSENQEAWSTLHALRPTRTRIQLFDMVWWTYFRQLQPVR